MAKVYYTEQEAATKLKVTSVSLANFVRDGKLRSYQDGPRKMFKVDEVDTLAADSVGEIELAPADTASGLSLSEADRPLPPKSKEDTVITADGVSIFDDEDLEVDAADPMAKTQVAPSLEDQVSIEGVGSGSGLLDLTRESDDTSLGAEVLDHIDMDGVVGSSIGGEAIAAAAATPAYMPAEAMPGPTYVEATDPTSGLFGGMIIGTAVVMLILAFVAMATMMGQLPDFVAGMGANVLVTVLVCVLIIAAGAVAGFLVSKNAASRQAGLQRVGQA